MEAKEIIQKLNKPSTIVDIFEDLDNWKDTYVKYSKAIHPDVCKEDGSLQAFQRLSEFKEQLEKGERDKDEAGVITYYPKSVEFMGDSKLLATSYWNYRTLLNFKNGPSDKHFQRYLPLTGALRTKNELSFTLQNRAVPLSKVGVLKQEYVNFILSRMLELCTWFNQVNYCHAGINPASIYVVPYDHGIQCISYYHMTPFGTRLSTISGRFSHFYPPDVFIAKKAHPAIDIRLSMKTAIWLLGDQSGIGTSLRKTHSGPFLDFVMKKHDEPIECYMEYRDMLRKNFDIKKFHIFNI